MIFTDILGLLRKWFNGDVKQGVCKCLIKKKNGGVWFGAVWSFTNRIKIFWQPWQYYQCLNYIYLNKWIDYKQHPPPIVIYIAVYVTKRCSTNSLEMIHRFIQSVILSSHTFRHYINPKLLELGSWYFERMFTPQHVSHVKCHVSHVMYQVWFVRCHVSGVRCHVWIF